MEKQEYKNKDRYLDIFSLNVPFHTSYKDLFIFEINRYGRIVNWKQWKPVDPTCISTLYNSILYKAFNLYFINEEETDFAAIFYNRNGIWCLYAIHRLEDDFEVIEFYTIETGIRKSISIYDYTTHKQYKEIVCNDKGFLLF